MYLLHVGTGREKNRWGGFSLRRDSLALSDWWIGAFTIRYQAV